MNTHYEFSHINRSLWTPVSFQYVFCHVFWQFHNISKHNWHFLCYLTQVPTGKIHHKGSVPKCEVFRWRHLIKSQRQWKWVILTAPHVFIIIVSLASSTVIYAHCILSEEHVMMQRLCNRNRAEMLEVHCLGWIIDLLIDFLTVLRRMQAHRVLNSPVFQELHDLRLGILQK